MFGAGSKVCDACAFDLPLCFVRVPRFLMFVKHIVVVFRAGGKVSDACELSFHCLPCGFQGF